MSEILNNSEVFGAGLLFGVAFAWTQMLLQIKWESRQQRKRDDHARHVALVQAELDEVARRIREECIPINTIEDYDHAVEEHQRGY
jgi:hypothetical protein